MADDGGGACFPCRLREIDGHIDKPRLNRVDQICALMPSMASRICIEILEIAQHGFDTQPVPKPPIDRPCGALWCAMVPFFSRPHARRLRLRP